MAIGRPGNIDEAISRVKERYTQHRKHYTITEVDDASKIPARSEEYGPDDRFFVLQEYIGSDGEVVVTDHNGTNWENGEPEPFDSITIYVLRTETAQQAIEQLDA